MQLSGSTISFNGINSSRYGLYLCSTENTRERDYGVDRSIEKENGVIKSISTTEKVINLQLVKLDKYNNPLPISEDELFEINSWLFSPQTPLCRYISDLFVRWFRTYSVLSGQVYFSQCPGNAP